VVVVVVVGGLIVGRVVAVAVWVVGAEVGAGVLVGVASPAVVLVAAGGTPSCPAAPRVELVWARSGLTGGCRWSGQGRPRRCSTGRAARPARSERYEASGAYVRSVAAWPSAEGHRRGYRRCREAVASGRGRSTCAPRFWVAATVQVGGVGAHGSAISPASQSPVRIVSSCGGPRRRNRLGRRAPRATLDGFRGGLILPRRVKTAPPGIVGASA
jgi:hypothetical protein